MLSGKRVFQGETSVERMNAILREELFRPSEQRPANPSGARPHRDALSREAALSDRLQFRSDLAFDLGFLSTAMLTPGTATIRDPESRRRRRAALSRRLPLLRPFVGVGNRIRPRSRGWELPTFQRLDLPTREIFFGALHAEGKTVVDAATWEGKPIGAVFGAHRLQGVAASGHANADITSVPRRATCSSSSGPTGSSPLRRGDAGEGRSAWWRRSSTASGECGRREPVAERRGLCGAPQGGAWARWLEYPVVRSSTNRSRLMAPISVLLTACGCSGGAGERRCRHEVVRRSATGGRRKVLKRLGPGARRNRWSPILAQLFYAGAAERNVGRARVDFSGRDPCCCPPSAPVCSSRTSPETGGSCCPLAAAARMVRRPVGSRRNRGGLVDGSDLRSGSYDVCTRPLPGGEGKAAGTLEGGVMYAAATARSWFGWEMEFLDGHSPDGSGCWSRRNRRPRSRCSWLAGALPARFDRTSS